MPTDDKPHHPITKASYYNSHPSGVETKEVTFYLSGLLSAAVKYTWRAGMKGPILEDLEKAAWCFKDEATRLAADGGSFEISGKWVQAAERVVATHIEAPSANQVLLREVLVELLFARMEGADRAKHVGRCSRFAELLISDIKAGNVVA